MSNTDTRHGPARRKDARVFWLQEAVLKSGPLHVRDAAEELDVSEMTIRRDVRSVPDLLQFLGGHIVLATDMHPRAPYELAHEADVNAAAKQAACLACLPLIRDEDTLFVDCGTTLPHLVNALPVDAKLTIICYAMNIADLVVRKPNVQLVLLGGVYDPPTASFYPTQDDVTLDAYGINLALMSAAGVDAVLGVTCTSFQEARLKQMVMTRAQRRVLVADRSKFGQIKPARFAALADFSLIATETGMTAPDTLL